VVRVELLPIYLRDHLTGSTVGLELVKRAAGSNRDGELGAPLSELRDEIDEDRATLLDVMRRSGVRRDPVKELAAWSAEKVGRLKLNGRLRGYSPLSRVVELEGLTMLVAGKRALWRTLAELESAHPEWRGIDFSALQARAESQHARLDALRTRAAALAFA
jgi:hypothetical protein